MNSDFWISVIETLPKVGRIVAARRSRLTEHERAELRLTVRYSKFAAAFVAASWSSSLGSFLMGDMSLAVLLALGPLAFLAVGVLAESRNWDRRYPRPSSLP